MSLKEDDIRVAVNGRIYVINDAGNVPLSELCKIRDNAILDEDIRHKNQQKSIYESFKPYIDIAMEKEARSSNKQELILLMKKMPIEDVSDVISLYLNDIISKKEKSNEDH